jgi:hypothetical protein
MAAAEPAKRVRPAGVARVPQRPGFPAASIAVSSSPWTHLRLFQGRVDAGGELSVMLEQEAGPATVQLSGTGGALPQGPPGQTGATRQTGQTGG